MENCENLNVHILVGCGLVCLLLAFFVRAIDFHSSRKKKTLIKLELGVAVLMFADAFTRICRYDVTGPGYWIFRVAYFLLYACILINQILLTSYLVALFMETGNFDKLPKMLIATYILPTIAMVTIIGNAFLNYFYYLDDANVYHRGPFFLLSFVLPFATMALQFIFTVRHRKLINEGLFTSIVIYSMFPILASCVQIFVRGYSLINLSMFLAAIALFWFALKDQNQELFRAATTELTTGLPNAFGFQGEIDRIMNYGDITIYNGYYFDMVRMSQINNKYGKKMGDEIIRDYALALKSKLDKDEIIGRLGGNYFVGLVKKEHTEMFLKLLEGIPVEFEFNGRKEVINISSVAGCYEIKSKNIPTGKIMGCTSAAVNYAKNVVHKPYVFWDDNLEEKFKKTRQIEENARKALENNEFEPFYQPKVDSNGNLLAGAEALARWRQGSTLIPPYEFVPVMEKNGSICLLDFYILERVCQDIKGWIEAGIEPVTVSVNFSRRNLGNADTAKKISDIVEKYDIPKKYIQVEITETLDEHPMQALADVVDELHQYGLTTAIDDFGTGSSSIKLLKEVKFDVMKIDKSFVDYNNETEKKILYDIIHMAENIGLDVVAEGVEEEYKVKELAGMGCYEIQGFYFDKPLEKAEFEKKLINKKY